MVRPRCPSLWAKTATSSKVEANMWALSKNKGRSWGKYYQKMANWEWIQHVPEEAELNFKELLSWVKTSEMTFLVRGEEIFEYLGPCGRHFALQNFFPGDWEATLQAGPQRSSGPEACILYTRGSPFSYISSGVLGRFSFPLPKGTGSSASSSRALSSAAPFTIFCFWAS